MEKFKYRGGDRKVEDVVKRSKQSGGNFDSWLSSEATFLKIREGDNAIRILPPTWDDIEKFGDGWELQVQLHRNVGPDKGTYLCLDKMLGKSCPVCDARADAEDEEEADAFKAQWRAIAWVIDRDNEKAGPQIMSLPITFFREINARSVDRKKGGVILIDDPEDGYDILFTRTGSDKRTKYDGVELDRDPTPVGDASQQKRWLQYIADHPLPDMLAYFEADHIKKVLYGRTERRNKGDDDEEDKPRARRGRPDPEEDDKPRSRRGRDEEDAPEEEDRPRRRGRAEPEEEAEDKPRSRRGREEPEEEDKPRTRRGREEPEEDAEDKPRRRRGEPEEDAEDTERPSRTKSRGKSSGEDDAEDDAEEGGKVSRRRGKPADEEDEEDAEDSPSKQAKGKLERLKSRR